MTAYKTTGPLREEIKEAWIHTFWDRWKKEYAIIAWLWTHRLMRKAEIHMKSLNYNTVRDFPSAILGANSISIGLIFL